MACDGSTLRALTANDQLDGHPCWSPDDTRIAYATYASGNGGSHVMLIDAAGVGPAVDLTIASNPLLGDPTYHEEENDPDFLPNGRIVYKTNRWTPWRHDRSGPYHSSPAQPWMPKARRWSSSASRLLRWTTIPGVRTSRSSSSA